MDELILCPVSSTSIDQSHQQFSLLNLVSANTHPTKHLDRGQPDVSASLSDTLRCCGLDPHLRPILPERYGNPIRSNAFNYISTGPSTSSWTQTHTEEPSTYESPNVEALRWSHSHSKNAGSNGGGIQYVEKRHADSVDMDDNAKQSKKSRKIAIACNFCRSKSFE
jgi:hypothetical protein